MKEVSGWPTHVTAKRLRLRGYRPWYQPGDITLYGPVDSVWLSPEDMPVSARKTERAVGSQPVMVPTLRGFATKVNVDAFVRGE